MIKNNSKDNPLSSNKTDVKRIYFDWAASAPLIDMDIKTPYGNPSSHHSEGKAARNAIEEARERCAAVLKVPPETLYFTSGGTESNSIALFSNLMKAGSGRILSSMTEHASIREGIETLEKIGKPTGKIAVDSAGRVTPITLEKAFDKYDDTRFISIMSVNNETGAVTDTASLNNVIRNKKGAPVHFHCDMVQAAGKIPIDIQGWEIDSASISAHKIGGPRGIGLLYLRKPLEVFYSGGGQERGIRGGTENIFGAIALANCLEQTTAEKYYLQAETRWNKLMSALLKIDRCALIPKERTALDFPTPDTPHPSPQFSPYILQAAFNDVPGEVMARALDDLGFAVSTGSACSTSSPERPVLAAMGVEEKLRIEGIRISQGYSTTDDDIDQLICAITEILKFL
ncbi:MAG: cysteine desulfurase [Treponema sp.]|nr:cysteine desulfurase [Treponema sp.]